MIAEQTLAPNPDLLLQEYHALIQAQIHGAMTNIQRKRLVQVEQALDAMDEQRDSSDHMQQQLTIIADRLDQLIRETDLLPDA
jgi:hypothetical protein